MQRSVSDPQEIARASEPERSAIQRAKAWCHRLDASTWRSTMAIWLAGLQVLPACQHVPVGILAVVWNTGRDVAMIRMHALAAAGVVNIDANSTAGCSISDLSLSIIRQSTTKSADTDCADQQLGGGHTVLVTRFLELADNDGDDHDAKACNRYLHGRHFVSHHVAPHALADVFVRTVVFPRPDWLLARRPRLRVAHDLLLLEQHCDQWASEQVRRLRFAFAHVKYVKRQDRLLAKLAQMLDASMPLHAAMLQHLASQHGIQRPNHLPVTGVPIEDEAHSEFRHPGPAHVTALALYRDAVSEICAVSGCVDGTLRGFDLVSGDLLTQPIALLSQTDTGLPPVPVDALDVWADASTTHRPVIIAGSLAHSTRGWFRCTLLPRRTAALIWQASADDPLLTCSKCFIHPASALRWLLLGAEDGSITVICTDSGRTICRLYCPAAPLPDAAPLVDQHGGVVSRRVTALHGFHAIDGSACLAAASADLTLRVWQIDSRSCLRTLRGHSAPAAGLALIEPAARHQHLISGGRDRLVVSWCLAGGCEDEIQATTNAHDAGIVAVHQVGASTAISVANGDAPLLWQCGDDGLVTRQRVHRHAHGSRLSAALYSDSGAATLALADPFGQISVWLVGPPAVGKSPGLSLQ